MSRKELRISAETPYGQHKIVSLKVRNVNALQLNTSKSINLEYDGRDIEINDEHISIYFNDANEKNRFRNNIHIHHTFLLKNDEVEKVDRALVADCSLGEFGIPFFASTLPSSKSGNHITSKKSQILTSFNPDESCLAFCFAVVSKSHKSPNMLMYGIDQQRYEYDKFDIVIFYTFLNFMSLPMTSIASVMSSTLRVNNGEVIQVARGFRASFPISAMTENVLFLFRSLIDRTDRLISLISRGDIEIREFMQDFPLGNSVRPYQEIIGRGERVWNSVNGEVRLV